MILPPTHCKSCPWTFPLSREQLQKRLKEIEYARENPNTPEGKIYREELNKLRDNYTELDRVFQPLLDDVERCMHISAEDLATRVH